MLNTVQFIIKINSNQYNFLYSRIDKSFCHKEFNKNMIYSVLLQFRYKLHERNQQLATSNNATTPQTNQLWWFFTTCRSYKFSVIYTNYRYVGHIYWRLFTAIINNKAPSIENSDTPLITLSNLELLLLLETICHL